MVSFSYQTYQSVDITPKTTSIACTAKIIFESWISTPGTGNENPPESQWIRGIDFLVYCQGPDRNAGSAAPKIWFFSYG